MPGRKLSFCCLFFLLLTSLTLLAGSFDLKVNDISGFDAPWPMVASLAFPEREIKDPSSIRIISGNKEIPSQVDVAATWRDGSIRWALAGFNASPQGKYKVEFGQGVKRGQFPEPLKVNRQTDGSFTVETGAAAYRFDNDKLLPEKAWLISGKELTPFIDGSGAGAYLVDNSGREARVSGKRAEVENRVLKEGPGRFVIKRSGWYVTGQGEKLARADAWFYFSATSPNVKITHSLILTEDTNRLWIKDYGLEFKTPSTPRNVYCAQGEPGKENERKVVAEGREIFMLQDVYPHFAERDSRALIGSSAGGQDTVMEKFETAGDWAHGDYGAFGVTLVMPWLAERFPKEISFGPSGIRAVMWSNRSGRELDFRSETLAGEYWQSWAEKGKGAPGIKKLSKISNNAQGSAHTHDVWIVPRAGTYNPDIVRQSAKAAARTPLAMADPQWLCKTEALGWPMHHKDAERFPSEEAFISDSWDRLMLPDRVFPMTGFINWGHTPYLSYHRNDGVWYASFIGYGNINSYYLPRYTWNLFARSGERRYYEFGHRHNRITGDFLVAHWHAPDKLKGLFTRTNLPIHYLPFYWGNNKEFEGISEIAQWPLEYYLTGDERSKDIALTVGEGFKNHWDFKEVSDWKKATGMLVVRKLVVLYMMEWDKFYLEKAKELTGLLINLEEQTGLSKKYSVYEAPMYKDECRALDLYFYYRETGDVKAKEAFLKLIDHRYRFNRNGRALYSASRGSMAFAYAMAYGMTGNPHYRRVVEETMIDGMPANPSSLNEEMKQFEANPEWWKIIPVDSLRMGLTAPGHPFFGMPAAMKILAEEGWKKDRFPVLVKATGITKAYALFTHMEGKNTVLNIHYVSKRRGKAAPEVFHYPPSEKQVPIKNVKAETQERIPHVLIGRQAPDSFHYHSRITLPKSAKTGLYLLSLGGSEPFTVLDTTSEKTALYCPEGFWSATSPEDDRQRLLGGHKPFYFRVPEGLEKLEIFLQRPQEIRGPDGTVLLEADPRNTGRLSVPVERRSGTWSISAPDLSPLSFARLLNVEPVVSYASPAGLPEGTTGKVARHVPAIPEPSEPLEFVEGIDGKAVRLSQGKSLSFPGGIKTGTGGYLHFPGLKGTIEFWYRPDWSTQDITLGLRDSFRTRSFITGPHILSGYRCGARTEQGVLWSDLLIELLCDIPGVTMSDFWKNSFDLQSVIGREENLFLRQGEWNHLAYTWAYGRTETKLPGKTVLGSLQWPAKWRIFGPLDRKDPVLSEETLKSYPETIEVGGKKFEAKDVTVRNTLYDFPGMLKEEPAGMAAYVFLQINSPAEQEVTLGMGADWWMQAWVNGKLVHDTTKTANIHHPFSIWNHMVDVKLNRGVNILAVRFIRGGGSFLALGGPEELKKPDPAALKWEFAMFVNGKRMEGYRSSDYVKHLRLPTAKEEVKLMDKSEEVAIGPLEGSMDMLRISDIVRYNTDFSPPRKPFRQDKNTRALFLFDGDLKGSSAFSQESIVAK